MKKLIKGKIQTFIQIISLFLLNSAYGFFKTKEIYGGPEKKICLPVLNCHACPVARTTCPVGAIQYTLAHHSEEKSWFPFYTFGILGVFMLLFGRAPCGWLCPFGFFQDILAKITKKKIDINKKFYNFRYLVLIVLVFILPYYTGRHWFSSLCPSGAIMAAIPWLIIMPPFPGTLGWFFTAKMIIFSFTSLLSVFSSRSFCKTMCPLGAILGISNRWSLLNIYVDKGCNKCGACKKYCPMDIEIFDDPGSSNCIKCLKCTQCEHVHVRVGFSEKNIKKAE